MSMQPATRSSHQPLGRPLGGTSGDWRHRILRFHVPLALVSAVVLVLFMTLLTFDAGRFPPAMPDIMTEGISGALPPRSSTSDQAGGATHTGPPRGVGGGVPHTGPSQGAGATPPMDPSMGMDLTSGNALSMRQLTFATGYLALGLLGLTLLIGPANLLLRKRSPISSYLSRDVGMWAAIFSVVHVIFGILVGHGEGILGYFVARDGGPLTNSFGLANWTGLAATVIVAGLLAISSDFALRKLKARTWKNLQRLNYALFALVVLHSFFYGALLRMESPFTLLLLLIVIAVFVGQAAGVLLWRRRHSRIAARSA